MKTVGKTTKEDSGKDCHAINKKDIIRWERTRMKEGGGFNDFTGWGGSQGWVDYFQFL